MKKILSAAFACAIGLSLVMPVNAEENPINPTEQKVLDYIENGITIDGELVAFAPGSEEYEIVKELLTVEGIDLTEENLETIKTSAKNFQAFMNEHIYDEITVELLEEMIDIMNPVSQIFGISLGYDVATDTLNTYDMNGNIIYSLSDILASQGNPEEENKPVITPSNPSQTITGEKLENTGDSYDLTFGLITFLGIIMIASGYFTSKNEKGSMQA